MYKISRVGRAWLVLILISGHSDSLAQPLKTSHPQGFFRYPLAISPKLNANFGEMRPNHFHMGLDLSTERRENLPIVAAAEGYIARVKIEPGGFGRAIYLNHPHGLTTLYAHMNDFIPELEQYVKKEQYARESWQIDLEIPAHLFPVKKGQFIGYSGNTGGSQGPHVHFEVRDTRSERCLNPLLFGFPIPDQVPPDIQRLAVFDRTRSIYEQRPAVHAATRSGNKYQIASLIRVSTDRLLFAIQATDRMTGVPNANGIYDTRLYLDEQLVGGFRLDTIGYEQTRYLNAHIDYQARWNGGPYYQLLSTLPGNTLDIYHLPGSTAIQLNDTLVHGCRLEVRDAYGNMSALLFRLQRTSALTASLPVATDKFLMRPGEWNVFENEQVQVTLPERALYDSLYFQYSIKPGTGPGSYSSWFSLHHAGVPVQESFSLRIRPDRPIPYPLRDRMLIRKISKKDTSVAKAVWELGWYKAAFREWGQFQLIADTIPPQIQTYGVKNGSNLSATSRLVVSVSDDRGQVPQFRAALDGKWLLFSRRGNTFTHRFDEHCPPGSHRLDLMVWDEAGNKTLKTLEFTR